MIELIFKLFKALLIIAILLLAITVFGYATMGLVTAPSHNRDWSLDQTILPSATISTSTVKIMNIRNFEYASTTSYTPRYYDKTFDMSKIKKAYYIVEPFSGFKGSAHTFLSFEFENNQFVAISIEIRKEKGEEFSPFKGLFNKYELMYVVADERDVIGLRANHRKDIVYVYPIKAEVGNVRMLFVDMLNRVNEINAKPEFYNSLTNTCTTNIVDHINKILPDEKKISPFDFRILLPAYSDKLALSRGFFDTTLPLAQARARYKINEKAALYANDPNFSQKIRE